MDSGTIQGTNQSLFKIHFPVCSWEAGELAEKKERQSFVFSMKLQDEIFLKKKA